MSCIERSAFSYYKHVFTYFESLFWLWSPWGVAVLPPALLSRGCCCGPHALSVECRSGSTRSTRSWDLHGAADQGWVAQLGQWNQEGLGLSAWNPTTAPWAKPLWQPRAPLMGRHPRMAAWPHGSFKGTSWRRCRSSPEHPGSACCTAGEAGHSAGCTCCWGAVQQAVCAGVWSPIATKPQLSQILAGWYHQILDRGQQEEQTALWIRNFLESKDVATSPNSLGIFLIVSIFFPKVQLKIVER